MRKILKNCGLGLLLSALACSAVSAADAAAGAAGAGSTAVESPKKVHKIDRSGKPRRGKASYYAKRFAGRKMADGTPMNPDSNIAASKTLPLGTRARVTNLENGKSAEVEIRDRGPYVDGRIIDLTPKTARALDFHEDGVAPVVVTPLELPDQEGSSGR